MPAATEESAHSPIDCVGPLAALLDPRATERSEMGRCCGSPSP